MMVYELDRSVLPLWSHPDCYRAKAMPPLQTTSDNHFLAYKDRLHLHRVKHIPDTALVDNMKQSHQQLSARGWLYPPHVPYLVSAKCMSQATKHMI